MPGPRQQVLCIPFHRNSISDPHSSNLQLPALIEHPWLENKASEPRAEALVTSAPCCWSTESAITSASATGAWGWPREAS